MSNTKAFFTLSTCGSKVCYRLALEYIQPCMSKKAIRTQVASHATPKSEREKKTKKRRKNLHVTVTHPIPPSLLSFSISHSLFLSSHGKKQFTTISRYSYSDREIKKNHVERNIGSPCTKHHQNIVSLLITSFQLKHTHIILLSLSARGWRSFEHFFYYYYILTDSTTIILSHAELLLCATISPSENASGCAYKRAFLFFSSAKPSKREWANDGPKVCLVCSYKYIT